MDILAIPTGGAPHFYALVRINAPHPIDLSGHTLIVRAIDPLNREIAKTEPRPFRFGYATDPYAPGSFVHATEFNLDSSVPLGTYDVQALVDGTLVASAPLTLRQRQ